jgi:glycosyltransferase involved in cell wall biosynthesis
MKIGMTFYSSNPVQPPHPFDSIRYVSRSLTDALTPDHELVFLPPAYICATPEEEEAMNEEFLRSCDVIVGSALLGSIPATRRRIGSSVPIVEFMLGILSRGAVEMDYYAPYLTTNDVLLVNCTADRELAHRYFSNARVRLLPFAIDHGRFHPLDPAERSAARESFHFREEDRILLYAGRITLQKNVHTLLKVFSAVRSVVPDAFLALAGSVEEHGSPEFGITPVNLGNTIGRLARGLGIPGDRVRLMRGVPAGRLRDLYNIADAKVNLTLHHDENFGLAQVEAMACGTPVIGTAWGGLKDTIVDGVSGYQVSAPLTPLGAKADWWEAVNRIVALLRDPDARERFRGSCARHAAERYSQSRYEATLLEILSESVREREKPAEPLQVTPFAEELWRTCGPSKGKGPPHLRGDRSYELYQELIAPIAGTTAEAVPTGEALAPGQVLSLAAPVTRDEDGRFRSNDPMYPFDIDVPEAHLDAFASILAVLREEPAITVERLCGHLPAGTPDASETLGWMLRMGILLRTRPVEGWLPPESIDRILAEPFFRIERVDATVDFRMG